MKGRIISPTLFNVVVNIMIRAWLAMTAEYQVVAQEILVLNVGICLGVFYADDRIIREWDSELLQNTLNFLIGLFQRYRVCCKRFKALDNDRC